MGQPTFTWWPWRTLAAVTGATCCMLPVAILMFCSMRSDVDRHLLTMGLSIFAGGNALILGWAIGDFGRTVLALLVAIAVASAFSLAPVRYGLLAPFAIVPAITASLSLDRSLLGFVGAAFLGIKAVLRGFLVWVLSYIATVVALVMILYVLRQLMNLAAGPTKDLCMAAAIGCVTAIANAYMIGYLFNAAHRVRTDPPRKPVESEADESSGSSETYP